MPGRYRFTPSTGTRTIRTITTTKKNTLPKIFNCLFCNAEQSVRVTLDRKHKLGSLKCGRCNISFQCALLHIECEIDVHAKWIDACEEVAKEEIEKEDDAEKKEGGTDTTVAAAAAAASVGKKRKQISEDDADIRSAAKRYRIGS